MCRFKIRVGIFFAVLFATLTILSQQVSAQSLGLGVPGSKSTTVADLSPDEFKTQIVAGDRVLVETSYDPNKKHRVIVKLDAPSLARLRAETQGGLNKASMNSLLGALAAIEDQHARFQADVARLEADGGRNGHQALQGAGTEVLYRYSRVLNGVALTAPRWLADEIAHLPYVSLVIEDEEWQIEQPRPAAMASIRPRTAEHGVKGEGILVGVIDSGIDYTRADLGGGIGPDFKVIGGYDFVNDDEDPMDDNFHGTAVAGVIAAEGENYQGVAPEAQLMALKACDGGGRCVTSHIIAAIERAVDPDQNVATDDAVDVLNMSLGSPSGSAFSPVAEAIDAATASGTVCVVSAGNSGVSSYHSVGHVAAARTAITVGAIRNDDQIARFSSRGPTKREFAIKPEILALGVAVEAPQLGADYAAYDGTSFSAPYVAGVAAMILEKQPDWTPALVKSALAQSAVNIGLDVWTQGFGLLDAAAALNQTSLVTPSTLSLGLVESAQASWTMSKTIELHNRGDSTATFEFALEAPSGVTASFNPAAPTLEAGYSLTVDVQFSTDTAALLDNDVLEEEWLPYTGRITATSADERLVVPFALVKSPYLRVETDFPVSYMIVHDRDQFFTTDGGANVYGEGLTFLLPNGSYDIMHMGFDNQTPRFIVRERLTMEGSRTVHLEDAEAMHTYEAHPRDVMGRPVSIDGLWFIRTFSHLPTGLRFLSFSSSFRDADGIIDARFSPIEGPYRLEWHLHTTDLDSTQYHFKGTHDSFDADRITATDPTRLRHITYDYRTTHDAEAIWPLRWTTMTGEDLSIFSFHSRDASLLREPFTLETFVEPDGDDSSWSRSGIFYEVFVPDAPPAVDRSQARLLYVTPSLRVKDSGVIEASVYGSRRSLLSIPGDRITYGLGPSHWSARFDNEASEIRAKTNTVYGLTWWSRAGEYFPFFHNQMQDAPPSVELGYSLLDEAGEPLAEGVFTQQLRRVLLDQNECCETYAAIPVARPGQYTVVVSDSSYSIGGVQGSATVLASMDLRLDDKNPPTMTALTVMSEGEYTDRLLVDQQGQLRFDVEDAEGDLSAKLLLREPGDYWTEVPLEREGTAFSTVLPDAAPAGHYDARVLVEDAAGNSLDFAAVPAFIRVDPDAGDGPPVSPVPIFPKEEEVGASIELSMTWLAAPTANQYRLHLASDDRFAALLLDTTISATSVDLALEKDRRYYWRVRGRNDSGTSPWSTARAFSTGPTMSTAVLPEEPPVSFRADPNFPNPFSSTTTIGFALPEPSHVVLEIFNVVGQRVGVLVDDELPAGRFRYDWNATGMASGLYVYRLSTPRFSHSSTMALVK